MNRKRHQNDRKTFAELTFEEQSQAMNMKALQFRKQLDAHLRRVDDEGRDRRDVLSTRLRLLQSIIDDYSGQVVQPTLSIQIRTGTDPHSP